MDRLKSPLWLLVASILGALGCGNDGPGGSGAAGAGGSSQGGSGGGSVDCQAIVDFDACRLEPSCSYVEQAPECAGQTGQSGCFWGSCDMCAPNLVCDVVRGGDGADGCVEAASCVMGD